MTDFADKRIVITGAASGIGAALADLIVAQGGEVIGLDRQPGRHVAHLLDLADPASVSQLCAAMPGPLHGLANVAGVPGTAPVALIGQVNLWGLRALTEALAERLDPNGAIVCVSSISADRCDWTPANLLQLAQSQDAAALRARAVDGTDAYQITKAALNILVGQWAERYAPRGIRVNAVSPGPVETPILRDFETSMGKDRIDAAAAIVGRHARPEEIAQACNFLLSDAASWINGQVLKADGGLHPRRVAQKLRESL